MGPRDRAEDAAEEAQFRAQVLSGLGNLQAQSERLEFQMNGRIRKLEHAVFGNEEEGRVGISERVRSIESGWAKITALAILFCSTGVEGIRWLLSSAHVWLSNAAKPH